MDPNLFHLDWERTFEALVGIVILSFFIERALSILFESRWFIEKVKGNSNRMKGLKEFIAFAVSAAVCIAWKFDAISVIFLTDKTTIAGAIITGAIVAGGSKASIKLFKEMMGFMSDAEAERKGVVKRINVGSGQTPTNNPSGSN